MVVAIDQHQSLAGGDDPRQERVAVLRVHRREDDAVDLAVQQHLQLRTLARRIFADVAQQQPIAERMDVLLDRCHDLDEEGVHEVGDEDAEGVRTAQRQAARNGVGTVAELLDLGEHALAHLFPDVTAIVEHLGDSRHRHPESGGDVSHGDSHRRVWRAGPPWRIGSIRAGIILWATAL